MRFSVEDFVAQYPQRDREDEKVERLVDVAWGRIEVMLSCWSFSDMLIRCHAMTGFCK